LRCVVGIVVAVVAVVGVGRGCMGSGVCPLANNPLDPRIVVIITVVVVILVVEDFVGWMV
jgi:hypothetical protein